MTDTNNTSLEHDMKMKGRRSLDITGVKTVESFDSEQFLLDTVMGFLHIKGQDLQMKNFDVGSGLVSMKGKIGEILYLDEQHKDKAKGFFSKLFK